MAVRTMEEARAWRARMENLTKEATDMTASTMPEAFPKLKGDGSLVKAGTRINWQGKLKRAAVDLWDAAENTPESAPSLWEDIDYKDGIRIIPDVITAGTAFQKDEMGWWGEDLYRSIYDGANVWTPADYPAGWESVNES